MASTWGNGWGSSWGNSWGTTAEEGIVVNSSGVQLGSGDSTSITSDNGSLTFYHNDQWYSTGGSAFVYVYDSVAYEIPLNSTRYYNDTYYTI